MTSTAHDIAVEDVVAWKLNPDGALDTAEADELPSLHLKGDCLLP